MKRRSMYYLPLGFFISAMFLFHNVLLATDDNFNSSIDKYCAIAVAHVKKNDELYRSLVGSGVKIKISGIYRKIWDGRTEDRIGGQKGIRRKINSHMNKGDFYWSVSFSPTVLTTGGGLIVYIRERDDFVMCVEESK